MQVAPEELVELVDVYTIIVTYTHRDHFDDQAISILPKGLPIFCQPADEQLIKANGFEQILPIEDKLVWKGIELIRRKTRS